MTLNCFSIPGKNGLIPSQIKIAAAGRIGFRNIIPAIRKNAP